MSSRCYPIIDSPCPRLPAIPAGTKAMWCTVCAKPVHNLHALDAAEQAQLLARSSPPCVSYRLPRAALATAALALLLAGTAADAAAQDDNDQDAESLENIVVIGGRIRQSEPYESVFLETPPTDPDAEQAAQPVEPPADD